MVGNITDSVEGITEAIKGNETIIKQLSAIASAVSSIAGIFNSRKKWKQLVIKRYKSKYRLRRRLV